jgi:hypothetical protein
MAKQILNEAFRRMQKLAGIIIENYVVKANDDEKVIIRGNTEDEIYSELVKKINSDPESWGYKVEDNILKDPISNDAILSTNAKQYLMDLLKSEEGIGGTWILSKEEDPMINEEEDYTFFDTDFKKSPETYPYGKVLNMIKSLENEKILGFDAEDALKDFKLTFKVGNDPVYKDDYEEFINEYLPDEIKKSYLIKWIELEKLNENDDKINYRDKNFSDKYIDDEGFDDDFDLNREFKKSQSKHSYDEVLEIIRSYENDNMINDFERQFKSISRNDYSDFIMRYIDDMSEVPYVQANWISITDPDIYNKAGLV